MVKLKHFIKEEVDYNKITPNNFDGFVKVKKKPITVYALQVNKEFEVNSKEGLVKGKANDWLMIGVEGERYICDDNILKKTYDIMG